VFDPFAGSATTGVAALALGRRFMGCEADVGHIELAIKRLTNPDEVKLPSALKQGHLWNQ